MTWRQRHLVDVGRVPGGDDEAARVRIATDVGQHVRDLVDGAAIGRRPRAPLPAIDWSELAGFVGPFVPDRDVSYDEAGRKAGCRKSARPVSDVGVACQEPE